jgi:hypothetical protein
MMAVIYVLMVAFSAIANTLTLKNAKYNVRSSAVWWVRHITGYGVFFLTVIFVIALVVDGTATRDPAVLFMTTMMLIMSARFFVTNQTLAQRQPLA